MGSSEAAGRSDALRRLPGARVPLKGDGSSLTLGVSLGSSTLPGPDVQQVVSGFAHSTAVPLYTLLNDEIRRENRPAVSDDPWHNRVGRGPRPRCEEPARGGALSNTGPHPGSIRSGHGAGGRSPLLQSYGEYIGTRNLSGLASQSSLYIAAFACIFGSRFARSRRRDQAGPSSACSSGRDCCGGNASGPCLYVT